MMTAVGDIPGLTTILTPSERDHEALGGLGSAAPPTAKTSIVRVTIGIPVHNGEATLVRAVESALAQTQACLIHVSDNASADATPAIGQGFAAVHERVRFTRHATTLGLSGNFRFVLQQAATPFFMWLAADDYILPSYVERMLAMLDGHREWVACASRVLFTRSDGASRLAAGTYPLLDDPRTNLARYLSNPTDNSRAFALHRTEPLQRAFPPVHFHAYDWSAIVGTLMHGGYGEVPDVLMVRDETPPDAYVHGVRRDTRSRVARILPLLPMTADLLRRQRIPLTLPVARALLHLNAAKHIEYARVFHRRYAKIASWAWRAIRRLVS